MLGETIKGFKITAPLGRGGMGEVWAAEQSLINTRVAIKLLTADASADASQVERFFHEAVAASKIRHAGIVRINDVGFHDGRAFLIMELLDGETLATRLRRQGRLPVAHVLEIGRQLGSVLAATHAAGIVHRDLKPDNVFLVADDELASRERVKVLDFGIAKLGGRQLAKTAAGGSMGTPPYMAPEQWTDASTAGARADVYSLGCLLFEIACGRPPFIATSVGESCAKHLTEIPPLARSVAPDVPVELEELIHCMLEKSPDARPTMQAVTAVLGRLAGTTTQPPAFAIDRTLPVAPTTADPTDLYIASRAGSMTARERPEARDEATERRVGGRRADDAAAEATVPDVAGAPSTFDQAAGSLTGEPARSRRGTVLFAVGLGAVALAGAIGFVATRPGSDDEAPAPALKPPKLGLDALAQFHDPTPAALPNLHSMSMWTAARDDFADACKQTGAPTRWCAARDFADGQLEMNKHDGAAAVAAFKRGAATDADWPDIDIALAGALSYQHDFDGALDAAHLAQRLDPTWWLAVASGARVYAAQLRNDDMIQEYRRALALAPKNAVLLAEVALAYHSAGMDTEADRYGDAALAIDDSLVAVHLLRAERLLEKHDGKGALAEADRVLSVSPTNGAAHLARGDAFALLANKAAAFAEYKRAFELASASAPDARTDTVRTAMAHDQLPPPRGHVADGTPMQPDSRSKTVVPPGPPSPPGGGAVKGSESERSIPTNGSGSNADLSALLRQGGIGNDPARGGQRSNPGQGGVGVHTPDTTGQRPEKKPSRSHPGCDTGDPMCTGL